MRLSVALWQPGDCGRKTKELLSLVTRNGALGSRALPWTWGFLVGTHGHPSLLTLHTITCHSPPLTPLTPSLITSPMYVFLPLTPHLSLFTPHPSPAPYTPTTFDYLTEASSVGGFDTVIRAGPSPQTKLIAVGESPMIALYRISKVHVLTVVKPYTVNWEVSMQ